MKAFYADTVPLNLPPGHRFPAEKYVMLRERVFASGLFAPNDLRQAPPASETDLRRVHTPDYVQRVLTGQLSEREIRRIGLPWSPELADRSQRAVGGAIQACRAASAEGSGIYLGGGTHHAYPDHGEGFCVFNDVAVAGRVMLAEGLARRILIVDCDVHQGNGTAAIFAGDPQVFILDLYGEKNFPFHKEPVSLPIPLDDGAGDDAYLEALTQGLRRAIPQSRAELAIYLAGADAYEGDRLGRLALTKPGLAERDRLVLDALQRAGVPRAVVMSGGYAKNIRDSVDIHFQTIQMVTQMTNRKVSVNP